MKIAGKWVPAEPTEEMRRAYRLVRSAIESGKLVRPDSCGRCGEAPAKGSDGRATIQAHHHDYSKPLDVEWICSACHRIETPMPTYNPVCAQRGSKNGASRLKEDQIITIRSSALASRKLAKLFGVDKQTILRVRRGETWKHIS